MKTEQFVMAYGAEQDRLRAILPDGFSSLRPVLRINAEIYDNKSGYIEFNTAVEKDGMKGWLNIGFWKDVPFDRKVKTIRFKTDFLEISFAATGTEGSCPAEKDNDGCYFLKNGGYYLRKPEIISVNKEFCDCEFKWNLPGSRAFGKSTGKTLPAVPTDILKAYPKENFTVDNAAKIPCDIVLGSYMVVFER